MVTRIVVKKVIKVDIIVSIQLIILSTLTGVINVGMDSLVPAESKSMASAIVGGVDNLLLVIFLHYKIFKSC